MYKTGALLCSALALAHGGCGGDGSASNDAGVADDAAAPDGSIIGACSGEEAEEITNDTREQATPIPVPSGAVLHGANCSFDEKDEDWYVFSTEVAGWYEVELDWATASDDLDIDVRGVAVGAAYHQKPERIELKYLPAGSVFVIVTPAVVTGSRVAVPYTLKITEHEALGCTADSDCGDAVETQIYRGDCAASGACVEINGGGALPGGARCDNGDDCASGACWVSLGSARPDELARCSPVCTTSGGGQCASMGAGAICNTTYENCQLPCTSDLDCPTDLLRPPLGSNIWWHDHCDVESGECQPG